MSCFHPITIKDALTGYPVSVPCNHCIGCLSDKRKMWSYRIKEEIKSCDRSLFVTLTYNDEHLPKNDKGQPIVYRKDVTNFMKRLRKRVNKYLNVRYFGCSEYGDAFQRPHYHLILFITYKKEFYDLPKQQRIAYLSYNNTSEIIRNAWSLHNDSFGFVQLREVRDSDVKYTAKYTIKEMENNYPVKTFNMMSTKPFIGYAYVDKMRQWHLLNEAIYYPNGKFKSKLPRIFYEKIFPEDWRRTRAYLNERHQLDIDKIVMFFENKRFAGSSGIIYIGDCDIKISDYPKYRKMDLFKYDFVDLDNFSKNHFYEPAMLEKDPYEYYNEYCERIEHNRIEEERMLEKYKKHRFYKSERNERLATINQLKNGKKKNSQKTNCSLC